MERPVFRKLLLMAFAAALAIPEASAAPFNSARIRRIIDGREVFIDKREAAVNQTADRGQELSTGRSRAEVLFDRRALGFLGNNSLIRLGEDCFRLDRGQVLINGPQNSCLGSKVLGIRGTTYVLSVRQDGGYDLAVLSGEASVSDEEQGQQSDEKQPDILSLYPTLNPVIGIGSSAWGSNASGETLGEAAGLILGDASFFLPLSQSMGSSLLYSYSTGNTNFDGAWGASTELGYKWFNPNDRSISSLLIGYDGWDISGCFHSQLAVGGLWQRGRWQLGATGGVPLDGCLNNLGYAIGQLGIPIADVGDQSITLSLSPYLLRGIGDSYGGGRLGITVPVSNQLTVSAYGQYDDLLDTVIGGQINYRFATNGGFVRDPNLSQQGPASPLPWQAREFMTDRPMQVALGRSGTNKPSMPGSSPSTLGTLTSQAQSQSVVRLQAGEEATFSKEGMLLSQTKMSRERFSQLVIETMSGQNLLPESHVINLVYERLYGLPGRELLGILGSDWLIAARTPYPRLRGANNLVVPSDKLPKQQAQAEREEDKENEKDDDKEAQDQESQTEADKPESKPEPEAKPEPEPEPEPILLTYVCRAFSGNPDFSYYTGGVIGGNLSQATRFQTKSSSDASCSGRGAGSDGEETTVPQFL